MFSKPKTAEDPVPELATKGLQNICYCGRLTRVQGPFQKLKHTASGNMFALLYWYCNVPSSSRLVIILIIVIITIVICNCSWPFELQYNVAGQIYVRL